MLTRARTIAALPAAGLALTLLAGGCGNDTDPKSVESTKPPTTLASPSTSAEAPTESTADTPESTTSTVTAATADVSGVGYMDGFRFELTGAEFGETSSGQSGLLVEADLENLNKDSDQRFDPSVSLEDSDGKAINGGVVADLVPSGSSSSATFEFNAEDGFDTLDGRTLLVGASGEAQVELPLDDKGEAVGRIPVELEPSESELGVEGVDVTIDQLDLRWYGPDFDQVGDDEIVLAAEVSARNGTESQTCVRDAIKFVGPDDATTAAESQGADCEPAGESKKGTKVVAVIQQPEAGEWALQVVGDWGPGGKEVTGEVTFQLTDEMISGTKGDDEDASGEGSNDAGTSTTEATDSGSSSSTSSSSTTTTTAG